MKLLEGLKTRSLEGIAQELALKLKYTDDYVLIDYCQIDSPKHHPIVKECRGIILDRNTHEVVCRPFDRFFNLGEDVNQKIPDWSRCTVEEKVDGSLIKVWWSKIHNKWVVSTRGTIYADSPVHYLGTTFYELFSDTFEKVYSCTVQEFFNNHFRSSKDLTFILEMATSLNRVVTKYDSNRIVLLGARSNISGRYTRFFRDEVPLDLPKPFLLTSLEDCVQASKELKGLEEGFVVKHLDGPPLFKVKSPAYVLAHRLRGNGSPSFKEICNLVWINEQDEYLAYFPEDAPYFNFWVKVKEAIEIETLETLNAHKDVESQKQFALSIKDLTIAPLLFKMRASGENKSVPLDLVKKPHEFLLKYVKEKLCLGEV